MRVNRQSSEKSEVIWRREKDWKWGVIGGIGSSEERQE